MARYRTTVAGLGVLVALAAAGVALAVLPRRAIDPDQPLTVCELQHPWARRHLLPAWGVKDGAASTATAALAEHLREAALSEGAPAVAASDWREAVSGRLGQAARGGSTTPASVDAICEGRC
ncbi:hypothetical protein ACH4ND_22365 [Streptomyces sp. NPDC017179]|uniref:hypothetical protein n=1 Tax=Streptomyces sp. NPDC017179 TaxID=3364979 RepID=UPI0037AF2DB7